MGRTKIIGVQRTVQALRRERGTRIKAMNRGLVKAGLWLLGESMELVPVHTGILRASGSVRKEGKGGAFSVLVGYYTDYAAYVHEDLEAAHGRMFNEKYAEEISSGKDPLYYFERGPRQQAKYLEQPAREGTPLMSKIVRRETARG